MFNLICTVLLFIFIISSVSGLVTFYIDIRRFKSDIEFSGNRKQLIEHLMLAPNVEDPEEVTVNETEHSDR
jgi:hypothetical protein